MFWLCFPAGKARMSSTTTGRLRVYSVWTTVPAHSDGTSNRLTLHLRNIWDAGLFWRFVLFQAQPNGSCTKQAPVQSKPTHLIKQIGASQTHKRSLDLPVGSNSLFPGLADLTDTWFLGDLQIIAQTFSGRTRLRSRRNPSKNTRTPLGLASKTVLPINWRRAYKLATIAGNGRQRRKRAAKHRFDS